MNRMAQPKKTDFTGCRILIVAGRYEGREGVCIGKSKDGVRWAVSPDDSDEILQLVFEKDFALLVDLSSDPEVN
jgi:hypothetical protein